ncbi:HAD family hydrolase [Paenibacillus periandrae]|uniref:HAD family hydrolase n=1 Tax=Paenibacillus periandrae TaxID=1761741 RepID=UPI001F08E48A|nr:HAD-IA family hydrolase [Paenibacillus periandrae]
MIELQEIRGCLFDIGETLLIPSEEFERVIQRILGTKTCVYHLTDIDKDIQSCLLDSPLKKNPDVWTSDTWIDDELVKLYTLALSLKNQNNDIVCIAQNLVQYMKRPEAWRVVDGAYELLDQLRASGKVLGVLSNWNSNLESILENKKMRDYFDVVVCSAQVRSAKPSHTAFRIALDRLGRSVRALKAEQTVMIGDSYVHDIKPCLHLGMKGIQMGSQFKVHVAGEYFEVSSLPMINRLLGSQHR